MDFNFLVKVVNIYDILGQRNIRVRHATTHNYGIAPSLNIFTNFYAERDKYTFRLKKKGKYIESSFLRMYNDINRPDETFLIFNYGYINSGINVNDIITLEITQKMYFKKKSRNKTKSRSKSLKLKLK